MTQLLTEPVAPQVPPVADRRSGPRLRWGQAGAHDVDHRVHPDVRGLADVRHPRRADPEGARALRPPAGLDQRRRGAQRLALAAAGRHAHRPGRRPRRHRRDAAAHRDPLLLHHPGDELPAAARARLPRRVRRQPVQRRHLVERSLVPQGPAGLRARRLRRRQHRRLGHQAAHRAAPDDHRGHGRRHLPRHLPRRLADLPRLLHGGPRRRRGADLRHRAAPRPPRRCRQAGARDARPAAARAGVAVQPLLRRRLRRLRGPRRLAAEVLRRQLRHPAGGGRAAQRDVHLPGIPAATRSAAGSPTGGAPAGSCTGPSP